jgi:hypothetical protein
VSFVTPTLRYPTLSFFILPHLKYFSVIPGRRNAPSPESITTAADDGPSKPVLSGVTAPNGSITIFGYPIEECGYGFRARALRVPE